MKVVVARFLNNIDRVTNRDDLKAEIESSLMRIDGSEIADRLANAGLAAGAVHDTAQAVESAHTKHREMVIEDGWYKMTGTPIKLSRTPGSVRHKPPKFGEHTQQILREFDFSDQEIQELLNSYTILERRQS